MADDQGGTRRPALVPPEVRTDQGRTSPFLFEKRPVLGGAAGESDEESLVAIYHAHVSSGSRLRGQSGAAKVAYVLRRGKYGKRYDLVVADYGNLPAWAADDPCILFEAADRYERKNGRLFVEIEVALPNELSESQQHELARGIAVKVTAPGLLPFTYAIHAGRPKSPGEPANPHAHILISERVNDGIPRSPALWFRRANRKNPGAGGAAKDRGMKKSSWVDDTRKLIEGLINEHLEQARVAERVTSDSHATRIEKALAAGDMETAEFLRQRPPGMHLGPTVAALERDRFRQKEGEGRTLSRAGEPTDRGDYQRAIAADSERLVVELAANTAALDGARAELQQAEQWVESAWSAGLADDEILRIYETSELAEAGAGWASVESAAAARVERKAAAETAAGEFPIDVEALCGSARDRGVDPVWVLEEATASFAAARTALLPDGEVRQIHAAAEFSVPGTGWRAVKASSSSREAQKEAAEAGAATFGLDIEGVYAGAQAGGADPVEALAEKVAEEERLSSARRAAVEQREGSVAATKQGRTWLLAAQREALVSSGRQLTLEQREKVVETVYQHLDEALRDREAALRSLPQASQYLPEVVGGAERLSTLAERESMVMTAEQRLGEDLEDRAARLVKSAGSDELLVEAFSELCALDTSFGDGSSLPERWRIITQAEQRHEADRAKREAAAKRQAEQERKTRLWEEQRDAAVQALAGLPGGMDLYHAHLADRDPQWDSQRHDRSSHEHIDAALAAAGSDAARLERLRDVLSNDVDAARYREELDKVAGQFKASDLDSALAVAEQEREKRETQQEAAAAEKRGARIEELFTVAGGDKALISVLGAHKPAWRETGTAGPADIDIVLDAAELRVDRPKPAPEEHAVVVDTEKSFPDTPSAALRQVGERFPKDSPHARLARRLADRTLVRALAAGREEPSVSPTLVRQLFTWLRAQIDKLLERLKRKEKYEEQVRAAAAVAKEKLPQATSLIVDDPVLLVSGQMFGRLKERARDGYVRDTISEVECDESKEANHPVVGTDVAAEAREAAVQDHLANIAQESYARLLTEHKKASSGRSGRRQGSGLELPTWDDLMRKETERHESQLLKVFEAACDLVRPQQHARSIPEAPTSPPEVVPELPPQQQGENATVAAARAKEDLLKKAHERLNRSGSHISFQDFKKMLNTSLSENTGVVDSNRPAPQTGETPAQAPADRITKR